LFSFGLPASAQAPGKIVAINGIDMHYEERGAGEPLLLLHGFGMCGPGDWGEIADELAKDNRVILVDLRGHGWSTNPSGQFTMRQSAEDIRALLDVLKIGRVRAMGISAGGMTLLHLATKYPDRVDSMVLIGATSHFHQQARDALRAIGANPPSAADVAMLQKCAHRGEGQVRDLMRQFIGFKDSYEDMNLTPPYLATIKARTLIVHGDRDEFFPVEIPVELYTSIPKSQLWIVPNGDHVPIYGARTPEFLRITSEFLGNPEASDKPLE
jgi:pimeloyl-ACP methyl ester carboxylesterase